MKPARDWETLARKAGWLLGHAQDIGARVSVTGRAPSLRIWHYPAEGVHLSWTLFRDASPRPTRLASLVREIRWDRPGDSRRLLRRTTGRRNPVRLDPTYALRHGTVPEDEIVAFTEGMSQLMDRPAPPSDPLAPDLDLTGIEGYGSLGYLKYEWAGPAKRSRVPLIRLTDGFRTTLLRCLTDGLDPL